MLEFYEVKTVSIAASGDVINFEHKLSGEGDRCIGVYFTIGTIHATLALGRISIGFNGGHQCKVKDDLRRVSNTFNKLPKPFNINQPLMQNRYVKGSYYDYGNAPAYPYNIKVHFKLIKDEE